MARAALAVSDHGMLRNLVVLAFFGRVAPVTQIVFLGNENPVRVGGMSVMAFKASSFFYRRVRHRVGKFLFLMATVAKAGPGGFKHVLILRGVGVVTTGAFAPFAGSVDRLP